MFSSRLVSPGGDLERVFHRWLASNIWERERERERGPPPLCRSSTTTIGTFPAATGVTATITIATTDRHLI